METYSYTIDSGIDLSDLIDYFTRCASDVHAYTFKSEKWQVLLKPLENRNHGVIEIPRTLIEFTGDQEICEAIIIKYRKKFMRGGG